MTIVYDEEEKSTAKAGDNVKLKLKGVEEEVGHCRLKLVFNVVCFHFLTMLILYF